MLLFSDLEKVFLDVEQCLNNRSLTYNDEDCGCAILKLNALVFGQENAFPTEDDPANNYEKVMRKRQKYIISFKKQYGKGGPKNTSKHSERDTI